MLFKTLAAATLLPSLALCWWPLSVEKRQSVFCVTPQQATVVANNYASLFTSYSNALANRVLTPNFQDVSDSVDFLINNGTNCPDAFGSVTFPSRAAFEAGSGSQPDIPFQILDTWVDCSNVIVRWLSNMSPEQVRGIAVLGTTFNQANPASPLINHIYSEFNSGAWAVNVGICKLAKSPNC